MRFPQATRLWQRWSVWTCLLTLLVCFVPVQAHAQWQLVIDDNMTRADSGPVAGVLSVPIGNGWRDMNGNTWAIRSNTVRNLTSVGTGSGVPGSLLRPASENMVEGRVIIHNKIGNSGGGVFRVDPSLTGTTSGYGSFVYQNNTLFLGPGDAYTTSQPIGTTLTADWILQIDCLQQDANNTSFTCKFFYESAPAVQVGNTLTFVDNTPALQNRAGAFGLGAYESTIATRVAIYSRVVGGPITAAPVASLVTAYRTTASLSATAAQGGVASLTYQWYQSDTQGSRGSPISGQTALTLNLTGLTPGQTKYYTITASDGTTPTPLTSDSNQLAVTTVKTRAQGGNVIVFSGDSITFGITDSGGTSTHPARVAAVEALRTLGYSVEGINNGESGFNVQQKIDGFSGALAAAQSLDADSVSIMIGTNDATQGTTGVNYKTRLRSLCGLWLASGTGVDRVILQYCFYVGGSGTTAQRALADAYNAAIDDICANDNAFGKIRQGDTTAPAHFAANPLQLPAIHPNQAGHDWLGGTAWATGLASYLGYTGVTVSPTSPSLAGGATQSFSKTVTGLVSPSQNVLWSLTSGVGAISTSGIYTAPSATVGAQAAIIRATSAFDAARYSEASITIPGTGVPAIASITITPATTTLTSGQTSQSFTAVAKDSSGTALSSQPTFTWSASAPVISSSGVLTVPAGYTITASASGISGTATATLPTIVTPTYASAGNVRAGINRGDGIFGTLALPTVSNVLTGVMFGAGGTEFTGTAVASGGSGLTLTQLQSELDTRGLVNAQIVSAILAAAVDGTITVKQALGLQANIGGGKYTVSGVLSQINHVVTTVYYRQDGITPVATMTTTYSTDNLRVLSRTVVFAPLP